MEVGGLAVSDFSKEIVEEAYKYPEIYREQVKETPRGELGSNVLVSGAGDSYAASITATSLSGFKGIPVDPRELKHYDGGRDTLVIAVSLGGRTRSLLESVKHHRNMGSKIIAVTGNPESPLAGIADETILVKHNKYIKGSGFGSYIGLTAAITAFLGMDDEPGNLQPCSPTKDINEKTPFFIGESWKYGVGFFGMLKMHEDLGLPSRLEKLEQFMHATIFSLQEYEAPVILEYRNNLPSEFTDILGAWNPLYLEDLAPNAPGRVIDSFICLSQSLTILVARYIASKGLDKPYYRRTEGVANRLARTIYSKV
jgi:D-arabinose 5-phosphate isomerase GutQ